MHFIKLNYQEGLLRLTWSNLNNVRFSDSFPKRTSFWNPLKKWYQVWHLTSLSMPSPSPKALHSLPRFTLQSNKTDCTHCVLHVRRRTSRDDHRLAKVTQSRKAELRLETRAGPESVLSPVLSSIPPASHSSSAYVLSPFHINRHKSSYWKMTPRWRPLSVAKAPKMATLISQMLSPTI